MQARRMASISACQVGSWLATARFMPSEAILPSLTRTAPKTPPVQYSSDARRDISMARRRNFSWSGFGVLTEFVVGCWLWVCVGLLWVEKRQMRALLSFLEERERTNVVFRSCYMNFQKIATDNA